MAQTSKSVASIDALRHSHPTITWDTKSAKVADVNCDGKLDTIVLGSEKNNVVVAVLSGAPSVAPSLFTFPVNQHTQDSFCSVPKRIEISPLDCASDEGTLPGCKQYKGCRAFSVVDDDCDSFHFYWDSSRKTLAWWRL